MKGEKTIPNLLVLYNQREWWVTRDLKRVRISEMDRGHAYRAGMMLIRTAPKRAVLRMLDEWLDPELLALTRGIAEVGDGLEREWDRRAKELTDRTPEEWVTDLPVFKALMQRAYYGT